MLFFKIILKYATNSNKILHALKKKRKKLFRFLIKIQVRSLVFKTSITRMKNNKKNK